MPVHPTPHDVDARNVYDSKDAVDVEIREEKTSVGRDHLVESPANVPHRWSNDSDLDFRVLVVKVPRPTTGTKLL